jgi:hypothetical protein
MLGDPRTDGSYVVMQLDALSWAQTGTNLGIAFDGSTPLSVDAWIRFNGLPASAAALSQQGSFSFGSQGSSVAFEFVGIGTVLSDPSQSSLEDDTWHYICATFDGGTVRLYIDGVFNTSQSAFGTGSTSSSPIQIGPGVQGLVRRVGVYNQALPAETVLANMFLAPAAATVVAYFDFSGVPPVERGPGAFPIALQNNAAMIQVSPALSLGTAGFVRPFGDRAINPGGAQVDPYSVQSWIYLLPSTNAQQAIFVNSDLQSETGIALLLQYDATVSNYRLVSQRGSGNDPAQTVVSTGVVASGVWTNVATTFNGTTLSLYLNGALDSSKSCAPIPLYRAQSDLLIGAALAQGIPVGATTLQGFIREVDVWNHALNAEDVLKYMTHLPDVTRASLVGAYNFTARPARNLANGHPIGLAEGAVLAGQLGPALASTDATSAPEADFPPAGLDAETLTAFRATLDIPQVLARCGPDFERSMQADIAQFSNPQDQERMRGAWTDVLRRTKEQPETLPLWVTQHRHNGEHLLVCHTPRGSYVAFRAPEDDFDDCDIWKIRLLFTLVAGVLAALTGVSPQLTTRATTYIGSILSNAKIAAMLAQGTTINTATVFAIVAVLYQSGFLRPLLLMIVDVGFWTLVRVVARMILIAAGVGGVEVLASLAATVVTFAGVYLSRPLACDPLPTVDLSSLAFRHRLFGPALTIRRNFNNDVPIPEWHNGLDDASDSPAAYAIPNVAGVDIEAVFTISGPPNAPVQIQATGGGILGAINPTLVPFVGNTATVTLPLPNNQLATRGVHREDVTFTWQYQIGAEGWETIGESNHRIYVVLASPNQPWELGEDPMRKQLPWTDVLDCACLWADGTVTADAATQAITTMVNSGVGLIYTPPLGPLPGGRSLYTDQVLLYPQHFFATRFLEYLANPPNGGNGNNVNCADCAAIVTSFANILGADVFASVMADQMPPVLGFTCNQILAIGAQPGAWAVPIGGNYLYHEVAWTGASGYFDNLYDACLQVDSGPNPWGDGPRGAPGLPLNWIFTSLAPATAVQPLLPVANPGATSYRERLATNTQAGIWACKPLGQWWYSSSGRRPAF